ncbi:ATP-binding cassette sub-family A member 13 [Tetrabaena socialis]|uniref:ATP-binding cassette sub-family A member 13 n=1 Tax=Tetrabaena socialis TaxID=47790 RepID=A0A2J8AC81_9CHLO|nr:ATP-binding cassette sub-family A member 13 [Tetrabaena socialis]|eukprot:PNH10125.1 ATP-binding cassette sub-family A member 13 [Tetrabaena socialis]
MACSHRYFDDLFLGVYGTAEAAMDAAAAATAAGRRPRSGPRGRLHGREGAVANATAAAAGALGARGGGDAGGGGRRRALEGDHAAPHGRKRLPPRRPRRRLVAVPSRLWAVVEFASGPEPGAGADYSIRMDAFNLPSTFSRLSPPECTTCAKDFVPYPASGFLSLQAAVDAYVLGTAHEDGLHGAGDPWAGDEAEALAWLPAAIRPHLASGPGQQPEHANHQARLRYLSGNSSSNSGDSSSDTPPSSGNSSANVSAAPGHFGVWLTPFPTLGQEVNAFYEYATPLLGLLTACSFSLPLAMAVRAMVSQRQRGLAHLLALLGLPQRRWQAAWLLAALPVLAASFLLEGWLAGATYLSRVEPGLLAAVMCGGALAAAGWAVLLGCVFREERVAATGSFLATLLASAPALVLHSAGAGRPPGGGGRGNAPGLHLYLGMSSLSQELSGGSGRKLQLALALAGRPAVLLLDEVAAGVDAGSRQAIWRALSLAKRGPWGSSAGGAAILFTSHHLGEVAALADRVAVLEQGRLQSLTPAAALCTAVQGGRCVLRITTRPAGPSSMLLAAVLARLPADGRAVRVLYSGVTCTAISAVAGDASDAAGSAACLQQLLPYLQALCQQRQQGGPELDASRSHGLLPPIRGGGGGAEGDESLESKATPPVPPYTNSASNLSSCGAASVALSQLSYDDAEPRRYGSGGGDEEEAQPLVLVRCSVGPPSLEDVLLLMGAGALAAGSDCGGGSGGGIGVTASSSSSSCSRPDPIARAPLEVQPQGRGREHALAAAPQPPSPEEAAGGHCGGPAECRTPDAPATGGGDAAAVAGPRAAAATAPDIAADTGPAPAGGGRSGRADGRHGAGAPLLAAVLPLLAIKHTAQWRRDLPSQLRLLLLPALAVALCVGLLRLKPPTAGPPAPLDLAWLGQGQPVPVAGLPSEWGRLAAAAAAAMASSSGGAEQARGAAAGAEDGGVSGVAAEVEALYGLGLAPLRREWLVEAEDGSVAAAGPSATVEAAASSIDVSRWVLRVATVAANATRQASPAGASTTPAVGPVPQPPLQAAMVFGDTVMGARLQRVAVAAGGWLLQQLLAPPLPPPQREAPTGGADRGGDLPMLRSHIKAMTAEADAVPKTMDYLYDRMLMHELFSALGYAARAASRAQQPQGAARSQAGHQEGPQVGLDPAGKAEGAIGGAASSGGGDSDSGGSASAPAHGELSGREAQGAQRRRHRLLLQAEARAGAAAAAAVEVEVGAAAAAHAFNGTAPSAAAEVEAAALRAGPGGGGPERGGASGLDLFHLQRMVALCNLSLPEPGQPGGEGGAGWLVGGGDGGGGDGGGGGGGHVGGGSFVVRSAGEAASGAKQQQLATPGCSPLSYWLASWCADLLPQCLAAAAVAALLRAGGAEAYGGSGAAVGGLVLLLVGYAAAALPWGYCIALGAGSPAAAQTASALPPLLLVPTWQGLVSNAALLCGVGLALARQVLSHIAPWSWLAARLLPLFRLLPPFCLVDGLLQARGPRGLPLWGRVRGP